MKKQFWLIFVSIITATQLTHPAPLNLFEPYDINIRLKKPAKNHFYFSALGEKSYNVKGYATDCDEEKTFLVNPLQIYEPQQNLIALYQGVDPSKSNFLKILDTIAGGPGGGVSNIQNGLFTPTGTFSAGQVAFSGMYGLGEGFFVSAHLPVYFVKLHSVCWEHSGTNTLFSGEQIQLLADAFGQDTQELFNLDTTDWKKNGIGDLTFMVEWQKDFPQRRPVLKSVQPNIRVGLSIPTSDDTCENVIMPVPFGADGSLGIPFGGGLGVNLANHAELGFSGQFWYYWSNQKERRIKTFPTQTSLLYPTAAEATKEFSFIQNFNLHGQVFSKCKRFTLKFCYQYWRKGDDVITPLGSQFNPQIANTAPQLEERTQHDVFIAFTYSPLKDDFERVIPQLQLFWKGAVKGMRAALVSSVGAQFSLIF